MRLSVWGRKEERIGVMSSIGQECLEIAPWEGTLALFLVHVLQSVAVSSARQLVIGFGKDCATIDRFLLL